MQYTTDAYLITCLTNLHAGSGDTNFGVVDNLVQRDPITNIPVIHASSLKGAIREYFQHLKDTGELSGKTTIDYIFGSDTQRDKGTSSNVGHFKFFQADLVSLPVRSNKEPFFRASTHEVIKSIEEKAKQLGLKSFSLDRPKDQPKEKQPIVFEAKFDGCRLDMYKATGKDQKPGLAHLGGNPALFHYNDFKQLIKKLPVIARNKLENGESKNLWYEEVVPRESRFIFFVSRPNTEDGEEAIMVFDEKTSHESIQIGANASIGYGFTKIEKIS